MQIAGSTVVVSGGSSGLGAACARYFAERGANIAILDIAPPRDGVMDGFDAKMRYYQTDVTQEENVQQSLAAAESHFGALSGAIVCAGILKAQRVLGRDGPASLADFRRVIEVNLIGAFNIVRLTAAALAKNALPEGGERGVIVMTSSVAAFDGQIGQTSYSASKGAIASMTLPLARDLARQAIRVVSIAPGVFETPMMQGAPDAVRQSLMDLTPFPPRLGRPDEFARNGPAHF